jgi:uncharacterized protein (DUF302 family)
MRNEVNYGIFKTTTKDYDQALAATKAALKEQGFGVLTEIDVKATMAEKLNAEFRRYDIIGACNPPLAHKALSNELDIGLLLPCNVIVYETDGGGSTGPRSHDGRHPATRPSRKSRLMRRRAWSEPWRQSRAETLSPSALFTFRSYDAPPVRLCWRS